MASAGGVYCTVCGHYNVAGRTTCERCGSQLAQLGRKAKEAAEVVIPGLRPGCVTAYSVLAVIGSFFVVVNLIASVNNPLLSQYFGTGTILLQVGGVIISLAAGYGVWRMKNWGRLLVIAQGLYSIASSILTILSGSVAGMMPVDTFTTIVLIVAMVITAYISYWFYSHRPLFEE